jgi:hypothetical protein
MCLRNPPTCNPHVHCGLGPRRDTHRVGHANLERVWGGVGTRSQGRGRRQSHPPRTVQQTTMPWPPRTRNMHRLSGSTPRTTKAHRKGQRGAGRAVATSVEVRTRPQARGATSVNSTTSHAGSRGWRGTHWGHTTAQGHEGLKRAAVNVNVNELRLGFSNTTRNPEGILSHNNRT